MRKILIILLAVVSSSLASVSHATQLPYEEPWTEVSVDHTICRIESGNLECWGKSATIPREAIRHELETDIAFSVTGNDVCVIRQNEIYNIQRFYCWGDFGRSKTAIMQQPAFYGDGQHSNCAYEGEGPCEAQKIASYGSVYCTIHDRSHHNIQCGDLNANGLPDRDSPDLRNIVHYPGPWEDVVIGSTHICAIRKPNSAWVINRHVYCHGSNDFGELDVPANLGEVLQVKVEDNRTCAISESQSLYCWGKNTSGESDVPNSLGTVRDVELQTGRTCAITTTDQLYCWGLNSYGENDVPSNLGPVSSVSMAFGRTCAITSSRLLRCWGQAVLGYIETPTDLGEVLEVRAGYRQTCVLTLAKEFKCWGIGAPSNLDPRNILSSGGEHTCAIDPNTDGKVSCWGRNTFGQTSVPNDLGPVVQVASGSFHTCALTKLGEARCWGRADSGAANVPANLGSVLQLAAGSSHTCAILTSGSVRCWGSNTYGQTVPPTVQDARQISTGDDHTCLRTTSGVVMCWGKNNYGQSIVPTNLGPVKEVAAGGINSCAITANDAVRCWGWNQWNRMNVPTDLGESTQLSVGNQFACALSSLGRVRCWGWSTYGETSVPKDLVSVIKISAGFAHACSVSRGNIFSCWGGTGAANWGQVNVPSSLIPSWRADYSFPALVSGLSTVGATLTVTTGDSIPGVSFRYQWLRDGSPISDAYGANYILSAEDYGKSVSVRVTGIKIGYKEVSSISNSIEVTSATLLDFSYASRLSVSATHSCAVNNQFELSCWNVGYSESIDIPTDLGSVVSVSTEDYYTCAITEEGDLRCWGSGPAAPTDLGKVTQLATGHSHVCVVTLERLVRCWGENNFGQASPPADLGLVDQVLVDDYFSCAITATHELRCWGKGSEGDRLSTAYVPANLGLVKQASLSEYLGCAISLSDELKCWTDESQLVEVFSLASASQVEVIRSLACAIDLEHTWHCAGDPGYFDYGQATPPADLGKINEFAMSQGHICASNNLRVRCWGSDDYGQSSVPLSLKPLLRVAELGPVISGSQIVGEQLTARTPKWGPGVDFGYQWFMDDVAIAGAVNSTYLTQESEAGSEISVRVTGQKLGYISRSATSSKLRLMSPVQVTYPTPILLGKNEVESTLRIQTGNWGQNINFRYKWFRDGIEVSGKQDSTYTLAASDYGKSIKAQVEGIQSGVVISTKFTSEVEVTSGTMRINPRAKLFGRNLVGSQIYVRPADWDPNSTLSVEWLRDGNPIQNATQWNYSTTSDDVGKIISVRITGSRFGYRPIAVESNAIVVKAPFNNLIFTGTATVGKAIWVGTDKIISGGHYTYQWLRNSIEISGADLKKYVLRPEDYGASISARVCYVSGEGQLYCLIRPAPIIGLGTLSKLTLYLKGNPQLKGELVAMPGDWSFAAGLSYQWLRDGSPILGATSRTYSIQLEDKGRRISLRYSVYKFGYKLAVRDSGSKLIR